MYTKRSFIKKALSVFLTVILATSITPGNALAEGVGSEPIDSGDTVQPEVENKNNGSEGDEFDDQMNTGAADGESQQVGSDPLEENGGKSSPEGQAETNQGDEAANKGLRSNAYDEGEGDGSELELESNMGSMASGEVSLSFYESEWLSEFVYDGRSVIYAYVTASVGQYESEWASSDDITLSVYHIDEYGDYDWGDPVCSIQIGDGHYGWIYVGSEELLAGERYIVEVSNSADCTYEISYNIKGYSGLASSFSVNNGKSINVKLRENWYTYKVVSVDAGTLARVVSCKSSNTSVAAVQDWGNSIAVKAKKQGSCTLTIKIAGGATKKVKVTVKNGVPKLRWTSYELYRGQYFNNKILYNNGKVKWSSTNKKVAKVSSTGKVTAVGLGTCYVKAKIAGKTLKCKVKVIRRWPNFGAVLYNYKPQGNYFVVKYKNKGSKTVYVTAGIKVKDCDSRVYNRNVYLKKQVAIKPGAVKYVRFYVKGYTHSILSDFTLYYKFKYDGGVYEGHVWDEDSVFKRNGSWYGTYQSDSWYNSWYYLD